MLVTSHVEVELALVQIASVEYTQTAGRQEGPGSQSQDQQPAWHAIRRRSRDLPAQTGVLLWPTTRRTRYLRKLLRHPLHDGPVAPEDALRQMCCVWQDRTRNAWLTMGAHRLINRSLSLWGNTMHQEARAAGQRTTCFVRTDQLTAYDSHDYKQRKLCFKLTWWAGAIVLSLLSVELDRSITDTLIAAWMPTCATSQNMPLQSLLLRFRLLRAFGGAGEPRYDRG